MSAFRIAYDGTLLQNNEMDVRELAPALLAAGDLLDAATRVLNGDRVKAQTNVKASFKTGCFGIDFHLTTDWALKVKDLFSSGEASAIANALEILGTLGLITWKGQNGLIKVIKWLRGRKIQKVEANGQLATIFVDEDRLPVDLSVLALLRDLAVRDSLEKLLSPLNREGITAFSTGTDSDIAETIIGDERFWFKTPPIEDDLVLDDTRKMAFSIVSLAFKDDNKWRLYDGAATIHATISDIEFLTRVDHNIERFAKGDLLVCMVHVKQWQTNSGARTEYEVIKVLEHRNAARQIPLPLGSKGI